MLTAFLSVGVVISLLVTELAGIVPGGIIVPGYLAVILDRPQALLMVALLSGVTWLLVLLVSRFTVLFGRRRFGVAVLIGLALSSLVHGSRPQLTGLPLEWSGIGYVVPGLIAHQVDRQGLLRTLIAIAIATPLTRLIVVALA